jgi:hypothetical protein
MGIYFSSSINRLLCLDNFVYWLKFGCMLYVCYECDYVLSIEILGTVNEELLYVLG